MTAYASCRNAYRRSLDKTLHLMRRPEHAVSTTGPRALLTAGVGGERHPSARFGSVLATRADRTPVAVQLTSRQRPVVDQEFRRNPSSVAGGGVGQVFDDACRFDADMDDHANRRDPIAWIVEPTVGDR